MGVSFNKLCSNVVPNGTYKAQLTEIKFRTGASGVPTKDILTTWTILEGPLAKKTVSETIRESAYSFKLKPLLTATGVDLNREFATETELLNYGIRESKGKIATIEVTTREYNGALYNNIKSMSPLAGSTTTAAEVLAEFDTAPELQSEKPHLDELDTGKEETVLDLDFPDDDIPF